MARRSDLARACAASALVLVWSTGASAAPGDLDPTFGTAGVASVAAAPTGHPAGYTGAGAALQADGKIVVVAESAGHDFLVQRFDAAGTPDPSFGTGGSTTVDLGGDDEPFAVAIQPDGRIVVVGTSVLTGTERAALARLTPAGAPDGDFGAAGKVVTTLGSSASAHAVALQPDGRILIAGSTGPSFFADAYVARFTAGGALDATFGTGGVTTRSIGLFSDAASALALQPDGAIVAGGLAFVGGDFGHWFLLRLLPSGAPDPAFGTGGLVETDVNGGNVASEVLDVVVQPDGRILAGGSTGTVQLTFPSDFAVARYLADGTLDASWGGDGVVVTPLPGGAASAATPVHALALRPDGKVLAVGGGPAEAGDPARRVMVARYLADGSLDPGFGDGGIALPEVALASVLGVDGLLQPDGRVVVGVRDAAQLAAIRLLGDPACGNGVLEGAETCDDGNTEDGDCCSAACGVSADGSACDDGDACTSGDACSAGACTGAAAPASGCRDAERGRLVIRSGVLDRNRLTWQWLRGDATTPDEIPAQRYTLCVYDGSSAPQPIARLETAEPDCDAGPCFTTSLRRTLYADPRGIGGAVRRLLLRSGWILRSSAQLVARGDASAIPSLPLTGAVTAQLHGENGVCLGSTYGVTRRNDTRTFDAIAD